jgi:hypothetical protein
LVVMSLSPFACSRTISISGAKGGSHAPTSLIASLNPPGLDAIPGQKALTSDHKTVLWCASSASHLRSGTLRLYKAGLQKRLVLVATSFSDAVAPFWLRLLPTRRTTGGAEAAHGQGSWQRQRSRRGACKSVTLAGFTSHQRQAEGEAILILSSVMRSLWIASGCVLGIQRVVPVTRSRCALYRPARPAALQLLAD